MVITILYPADYFDTQKVDEDYLSEWTEAGRFPEFYRLLYAYDSFAAKGPLKVFPSSFPRGLCIYRGWMLQPSDYRRLYEGLKELGLTLINSPECASCGADAPGEALGPTNEYRAFYVDGQLLTLSPNSNQPSGYERVPVSFVNAIPRLDSRFYTVDFAQLTDGGWTVIETGDGQVSGLSPNQFIFKFYDELRYLLC